MVQDSGWHSCHLVALLRKQEEGSQNSEPAFPGSPRTLPRPPQWTDLKQAPHGAARRLGERFSPLAMCPREPGCCCSAGRGGRCWGGSHCHTGLPGTRPLLVCAAAADPSWPSSVVLMSQQPAQLFRLQDRLEQEFSPRLLISKSVSLLRSHIQNLPSAKPSQSSAPHGPHSPAAWRIAWFPLALAGLQRVLHAPSSERDQAAHLGSRSVILITFQNPLLSFSFLRPLPLPPSAPLPLSAFLIKMFPSSKSQISSTFLLMHSLEFTPY